MSRTTVTAPARTPDVTDQPSTSMPWLPLVSVCLGYFVVILDATVVNVALSDLGRDLGARVADLQWVVDGYTLVFAALLLTAGGLADRFGARQAFQAGLLVFTACSLACALAPDRAVLIGARLAQGVGAAMLVPASLALLNVAYPDRAVRAKAIGIWGGIGATAAGFGPIVGGVLVQAFDWRAVFLINLPVGVVASLLVAQYVPATRRGAARPVDLAAQVAAVATLGGLTWALIESNPRGWSAPPVLLAFAVAAAAAVAFVAVEGRSRAPMLPLGMFRNQRFASGNAVGLLLNLGFYGQLFVMSLYLQRVRHQSALMTGVELLAETGMGIVASTYGGRLAARAGVRLPTVTGMVLGALGFAGLAAATAAGGSYGLLVVPLILVGFGTAFAMPAATVAVVASVETERSGVAAGAFNAFRQTGGVIGVALLGTLFAGAGGADADPALSLSVAAATFALGAALATALGGGRR